MEEYLYNMYVVKSTEDLIGILDQHFEECALDVISVIMQILDERGAVYDKEKYEELAQKKAHFEAQKDTARDIVNNKFLSADMKRTELLRLGIADSIVDSLIQDIKEETSKDVENKSKWGLWGGLGAIVVSIITIAASGYIFWGHLIIMGAGIISIIGSLASHADNHRKEIPVVKEKDEHIQPNAVSEEDDMPIAHKIIIGIVVAVIVIVLIGIMYIKLHQ